MDSFQEMVWQLFSVNVILMQTEDAKQLVSRKFKHDLAFLMNQFADVDRLNLTIRDLSNHQAYPLNRLRLKFSTIENYKSRPSQTQWKKLLLDRVSSMSGSSVLESDERDTPWYDEWKKLFLESVDQSDHEHEFVGANFGCFFVMTVGELSNFRDVVASLLTQIKQLSTIRWLQPDFVRFFIVISEDSLDPSTPESFHHQFNEMASIYPNCFWLKLAVDSHDHSEEEVFHAEESIVDSPNITSNHVVGFPDTIIDPLSKIVNQTRHSSSDQSPASTPAPSPQPPISRSNGTAEAVCLLPSVLERISVIDNMLREFVSKVLIPWTEKQIKLLSDSISQRKGLRRSILGATKSLLNNMTSSTVGLKTGNLNQSVVYSVEAPEMQQRKLGDLTMCLCMYELAFQSFHAARKDFQNDGAWLYYSGASEASAIASHCCGKFQRHYFDQAISCYVDTCKSMVYATRATIFATEAIRKAWPNEAANFFIRMTGDDSDLRSALFLEQASKCFLEAGSRSRKAAFHYILAGHRYNRCALRHFALSCYQRFNSAHWVSAADHVNLTIARLYLSIANSGGQRYADYKSKGLEILRINSDKLVFYNEFLREIKRLESPADESSVEKEVYYLKIPYIRSIKMEPIEGSYLQADRAICFMTESVNLKLSFISPFHLEMHRLKLLTDNANVSCPSISVILFPEEQSLVSLSLIPQSECDFEIIGIEYAVDDDVVMRYEISEKMKRNLKFRSIRTLPLIEIDINLAANEPTAGPFDVLAGEIIDMSIALRTRENTNWRPTSMMMTTDATVVDERIDFGSFTSSGDKKQKDKVIEVGFDRINTFKVQMPTPERASVVHQIFKLSYFDSGQKKSRVLTKRLEFSLSPCLYVETMLEDVVSLRNASDNQSIVVTTRDNEPVEIPALLTAHLLFDQPIIFWSVADTQRHGIINLQINL